jgi:hypothetical protein
MPSLGQFDASDLPIAERGAPDRTDKAGRRADSCEGQAEFSRSGEAAEKVWAVSASGQEHLGQFATSASDVERGLLPRRVSVREPHWYIEIVKCGCLLCGARSGDPQRIRIPGERPADPSQRFIVDEFDWACGSHFL